MDGPRATDDATTPLTRTQASQAVNDSGWRFLLGALQTAVPVTSLADAVRVVGVAAGAAGAEAGDCLRVDLRPERVTLTLMSRTVVGVTAREVRLARQVTDAVRGQGWSTVPATDGAVPRSVQTLELAIDALDIPAIRPFWKAVMAYVDEPGHHGPTDPLVDPLHQGPALWFQQMDAPRPQRNRIHLDLCLPHDEASQRLRAALEAGGTLVSDRRAPAFWILADAEGNEICLTTWQGRD